MSRSDPPSSVDDRLRAALSAELPPDRDGVDMSPAAITGRLRDACELSSLALELAAAGRAALA